MPIVAATKTEQELVVEVHDLSRQLVEEPTDEEVKKKLAFYCQVFLLKLMVGDDMEKAIQMGSRVEKDVQNRRNENP